MDHLLPLKQQGADLPLLCVALAGLREGDVSSSTLHREQEVDRHKHVYTHDTTHTSLLI